MKVNIRQKAGMNYLYANISVSGLRVKASLGISINQGVFSPKSETIKGDADDETNILIGSMKTGIMELIRDLQKNGQLSKHSIKEGVQTLRESLTNPHFKVHTDEQVYLVDYAKAHIELTSGIHKKSATAGHKISLSKLEMVQRLHNLKLTFNDINMEFYNSFLKFCTTNQKLSN
jgi:hypothetical protein